MMRCYNFFSLLWWLLQVQVMATAMTAAAANRGSRADLLRG